MMRRREPEIEAVAAALDELVLSAQTLARLVRGSCDALPAETCLRVHELDAIVATKSQELLEIVADRIHRHRMVTITKDRETLVTLDPDMDEFGPESFSIFRFNFEGSEEGSEQEVWTYEASHPWTGQSAEAALNEYLGDVADQKAESEIPESQRNCLHSRGKYTLRSARTERWTCLDCGVRL